MVTIISLIILIASLVVVAVIVIKKFPALAILDVGNIPGEKEAKFKDEMMRKRVERDVSKLSGFFGRLWLSLSRYLSSLLQSSHAKLNEAKTKYRHAAKVPFAERKHAIKELFFAYSEAMKKEDWPRAESQLVEIVSLDQKNLLAFFRLGDLYGRQKKWTEARETYGYSLKLARQQAKEGLEPEISPQEVFYSLSWIEKEAGDLEAALDNIREALDLEPNSPRYLDLILDLSIMRKDKSLATMALEKLVAANPENNKLADWQEKIDALPDEEADESVQK